MLNKLSMHVGNLFSFQHNDELKPTPTRTELFKLCQLFVFIFAFIFVEVNKLPLYFLQMPSVEQWSNLLPGFFNGEQDFLFSYGPLYWLQGSSVAQYSKASYLISLFFISFFTAVNWALIIRLAIKYKAGLILAVIYAVFIKSYSAHAVFFTLPFFIVVYLRASELNKIWDNKAFLFLMGGFVAFLFYFRFFYGMIGIITIGSYLFSIHVLKRKYASLIIFIGSMVALYVVFGFVIFHNARSIVDYIIINSQLNFGNSVDMNYDVTIKLKAYVVIFATIACFNIYLIKNQRELLLTVNALLLIFLKIGFSRADHYISYFIMPVVLFSLLLLISRDRFSKLLCLVILLLMVFLGRMSIFEGAPKLPTFSVHEDFTSSFEERAAQRHPEFRLPDDIVSMIGDETVDVYPYNNEYALTNKLNYLHRPSFQNYMTLTPKLDQLNVDFFNSDSAPEYILWTGSISCNSVDCDAFDDFDGKYVLNEDPLTTMAILNNYTVVRVVAANNNKPIMVMKKNVSGHNVNVQKIKKFKASFGEWIKVPSVDNAIVKVLPDFKLTPLAKLQNLFFHGSILYVNYKLSNGEIKRYRLNIINSKSGVLAAPLFNAFPLTGQHVVEVMFETTDHHYFKPQFNATLDLFHIKGIKVNEPRISVFSKNKPQGFNEVDAVCGASIDSLEQSKLNIDDVVVKRLNSSGWAALSIENNLAPQAVWLTLQDEQGRKFYVPVDKTGRKDVADYFKKSNLADSGYKVFADITAFKGNYKAGLAIAGEGNLLECNNFSKPITIQ
jgi:hypothetical protein